MNLLRRVCRVMSEEGIAGLGRRLKRRLIPSSASTAAPAARRQGHDELIQRARDAHTRAVEQFRVELRRRGLPDVSHYYWYHTVDLGNGLVTPGDYDHRDILGAFHFPEDMRGIRVLDVGAATGFFSFEFERRGADVVAVDLPSLADWDVLKADRSALLAEMHASGNSASEFGDTHLEGPFRFCHTILKSKVRKVQETVYRLTPERLGVDGFDLIYLGDVTPHVFSPLQVLDVAASLCKKTLIMSLDLWQSAAKEPGMLFTGGPNASPDNRSWWQPNRMCLDQMLRRVGFQRIEEVGRARGVVRRIWQVFDRPVIRASK